MRSGLREQITELLTGIDTCFLLGAGCSVCAGKPMLGKLTEDVLKKADKNLKAQFDSLKVAGDRAPTIEDLINYLVRYHEILGTIKDTSDHGISIQDIDNWLAYIKEKIVESVADNWKPSAYHKRFLQRMSGHSQQRPRDLFSLNYDTLLEASLDELRLSYVDGFRGTNRAWFDPETFDETGAAYRIFKLHGSINWTRDSSRYVRRGHNAPDEPVVVYPSEQKYQQTQHGVYENLIGRFRNRLRETEVNNCVVVLGYSFNDEHINNAICDSVLSRGSNLTVIAFIGPDTDRNRQNEKFESFAERCDERFNAFIGNSTTSRFIGNVIDPESVNEVLETELWKFENLVDFVAGEE